MLKLIDEHFEEAIIVALISAMSLLIGVQVFMRYAMSASLSWSEELSRYLFIWLTYLGVAFAVRRDAHIRVTMLVSIFPPRLQLATRILTHVIFAGFAAFVMYQGWFMVERTFRFGQTSASLGIPMGFVYLAPVTGFALTLARLAQATVLDLMRWNEGDAA